MLPPESLAKWNGFVTKDGRRGGVCAGVRPICVGGHFAKVSQPVLTEAITHCTHRTGERQAPCSAQLYIARLNFGGSARFPEVGEAVWLVVEITPELIQRMKQAPMTFVEKMEIIALVLPTMDLHLSSTAPRR